MKVELKVVGGSRSGQSIPITIPQFMIGRASDCHLKPRSELISRYHCTILSEEAYVAVRDLGSKNGVYVNGERVVGERELKNGDKLMIGPLEFEVVLSVALKGEMKPKVSSISEVVARAVEQNSINVATAKQSQAASQPAPAQPAPAPA
ncbi:MAG: FHA domain-containing protein, partial [Thermoguttaceae bacterium]|nr:FHA domain-containing protein [Thermoguttaceae bacterium]